MGKLIIDGNSFFEIDENCIKKKKLTRDCELDKYLREDIKQEKNRKTINKYAKRGDG